MRSKPCAVQPVDGAPRVEHGLPAHLQRAHDVRADDVVGARQLRRHARVVVGQAEPQRRDAEPRQQLRQPDVPAGVGVPLRHHDHGRASPAPRLRRARGLRREPAGHHRVVGFVRRASARSGTAACRPRRAPAVLAGESSNAKTASPAGVKNACVSAITPRTQRGHALVRRLARAAGSSGSQSRPHSKGRTTRSFDTDARRCSQPWKSRVSTRPRSRGLERGRHVQQAVRGAARPDQLEADRQAGRRRLARQRDRRMAGHVERLRQPQQRVADRVFPVADADGGGADRLRRDGQRGQQQRVHAARRAASTSRDQHVAAAPRAQVVLGQDVARRLPAGRGRTACSRRASPRSCSRGTRPPRPAPASRRSARVSAACGIVTVSSVTPDCRQPPARALERRGHVRVQVIEEVGARNAEPQAARAPGCRAGRRLRRRSARRAAAARRPRCGTAGPRDRRSGSAGTTPPVGTSPNEGFRPTTPHAAAGMRIEPPVSVPIDAHAMPVATETAEPPDDPPEDSVASRG